MLNSRDYLSHISRVQRTPSVLTDVPQYPNAQLAFKKKDGYEEYEQQHHHRHHSPEKEDRVVVAEYEQTTEIVNGNGQVIYQEKVDVDVETDKYLPRRNKPGFELHKWKTFK